MANTPIGGYGTGHGAGIAFQPGMPGSVSYTPDYQALIQQDPAFMALQQQLSAQGITDQAQRQAATEQALIQFGMVPDFANAASQLGLSPQALQMLQADIDPNAARLAQANTSAGLSTEARLQAGQQHSLLALRNALAANGALSSGDDAYRTGLQNQSYAQSQSDALNSLLAAIGGYQSQYLTQHQAEQQQLQQGLETAQQFESGLPQNQGFQLHYDVRHGVYRDATGNSYGIHANGNGTWTLTNSATGSAYTLGANGQLTSGTHAQAGSPPLTGGNQPPAAFGPSNSSATLPALANDPSLLGSPPGDNSALAGSVGLPGHFPFGGDNSAFGPPPPGPPDPSGRSPVPPPVDPSGAPPLPTDPSSGRSSVLPGRPPSAGDSSAPWMPPGDQSALHPLFGRPLPTPAL